MGPDTLETAMSITVPLHFRSSASYIVRTCNEDDCTDSMAVDVVGSMTEAVGFVKASNPDEDDRFGAGIALSEDGKTLVVGSAREDSSSTSIDGDQASDGAEDSGAVYVFVRDKQDEWSQQAYIKASNSGAQDQFGYQLALSADGRTLAVSALDDSSATGINGDQTNDGAEDSGAVYVFVRDEQDEWSQQAYIKPSNSAAQDQFGFQLGLSGDGKTLAVSAIGEDSDALGSGGDPSNDDAEDSGAVYVFERDDQGAWSQQAYVKSSYPDSEAFGLSLALSADGKTIASFCGVGTDNSVVFVVARDEQDAWDHQTTIFNPYLYTDPMFGWALALSADGTTLAIGDPAEPTDATGVDGDQTNKDAFSSGAVYLFARDEQDLWSQRVYFKPSNPEEIGFFGWRVSLSADASALAVRGSDHGDATGINGNQDATATAQTGATYVFASDAQGVWSQRAYIKPNAGASGSLRQLALSGDADTLAAGCHHDSSAAGVDGDQADDSAPGAGAVYVY